MVAIFGDDTRIATHSRTGKGRWSTIEAHLPEHRRDWRHRSRSYWKARAEAIGPETAGLVEEVFDGDDVLSHLRKAQSIVTHLAGFPVERAEAPSRRARHLYLPKHQIDLGQSARQGAAPASLVAIRTTRGVTTVFSKPERAVGGHLENGHEPH